uniref:Galactokinase n=1 Tax=Globodera rostochiensis TaxID=31243 RepID=A0A914H4M8_GLORO
MSFCPDHPAGGNDGEAFVVQLFRKHFDGRDPEWLIRCPGRVNLIGEHIDYSDYSVLPMAIQHSTWVAVGRSAERRVQLANEDDKKYPAFTLDISRSFADASANGAVPKWHHYFLAGWRGILETLGKGPEGADTAAEALEKAKGLRAVVASRIPPSAGLSSSSALVCAAALATLCVQTNGQPFERISKKELAELTTHAERFACECLARRGEALRIDFRPLGWRAVRLPDNALFAVLHSNTEMNKTASAFYNQRVVECRIAAQVIAKRSGCVPSGTEWHSVRTLRQVAALLGKDDQPEQMLSIVDQHLAKPGQQQQQLVAHSREEICAILNCTDAELAKWSLNANTQNMHEFWLTKRARHVYAEAARVLEFESVCREERQHGNDETLGKLAELMNASHLSCAQLFECSCPELDETVANCLSAGCIGARLTGAGWGGCAVALVDKAKRAQVEASGLNVLFWSEPCEGIEAFPFRRQADE